MKKNEKLEEKILREIDFVTGPSKMLPAEALEFLESLVCDLEARIDGLRDDLKEF